MSHQRVGIAAECICDLPKSYLKEHNIGVIYFLVQTDRGIFTDTDEVTAENIIGYMEESGSVPVSSPPGAEVYGNLFGRMLETYGEVIFISTGAGVSASYEMASEAVSGMGEDGKKIHIFDSMHLSTGMGHVIIRAVQMAEEGLSAEEIMAALTEFRNRVSTSFITVNADYLFRNGRVSQKVKKFCDVFGIHPVLAMRNGSLTLKSVMIGNYERAGLRYVRRELGNVSNIDKTRMFITHVGCSTKKLERIKEEINRKCRVEELTVTKASATVSCNSGPGTFGILFVAAEKNS